MFWTRSSREWEREIEANRVKREKAEREEARQIQELNDRAKRALKTNDIPAMKDIVEKAKRLGFDTPNLTSRIFDNEEYERKQQRQRDEKEIFRNPRQAIKTHLARGDVKRAVQIAKDKGLKNEEIVIRQQMLEDATLEYRHEDAAIHAARLSELTSSFYHQAVLNSSIAAAEVVAAAEAERKRKEKEAQADSG